MSRGTLDHNSWSSRFTYRTITFYGGTFQFSSVTIASTFMLCPQPRKQVSGLGSFPFARRYSENHSYFLFLQVLRCFSSLRLASSCLCIRHVIHGYDSVWVPPFGYRRLFTCLPLTVAFRCLLRPSSPECA